MHQDKKVTRVRGKAPLKTRHFSNNKIEFYNPGRLPDNITVEDLLSNNYKSTPRNKLVADFCKNLGLIEKYGSGIRRIVDSFKAENLPVPEFRNISDGFMVTVFGKEKDDVGKDVGKDVTKDVTNNVTDNVTDRSSLIISLIKKNNKISTAEIANKLNVTKRTIIREINLLKNNGYLKGLGPKKADTGW